MNNLGYLATIAGVDFYEHPEFGDEAPVQYMLDGKLCDTPFWDLDDPSEIKDWIANLAYSKRSIVGVIANE